MRRWRPSGREFSRDLVGSNHELPTPASGGRSQGQRSQSAGSRRRRWRAGAAAAPQRRPNAPVPVSSRPIPVQNGNRAGQADDDDEDEDSTEKMWRDFFKQAPAWLVSASFHSFILIILGVWVAVQAVTQHVEEVEISAEPMRYAEQLGEQLKDPSVLEGGGSKDMQDPTADKQIIVASNLPPVDDPFAAPMPSLEIAPGGKWAASDVEAPAIGLALSGRQVGSRNVLLGRYGGNATTESRRRQGARMARQTAKGGWLLEPVGPLPRRSRRR